MTLPEMLRTRRKELGMTTQQVADLVKKGKRSYEYYEDLRDPTTPDIETVFALSKVLKFDLAEVYDNATTLRKVNENETQNAARLQAEKEDKPENITLSGKEKDELTIQILFKLANANEMLAYSNKELAIMAKRERATAGMPGEIVEAFGSTIQSLQDVVIDLALGRKFQDREDVAHALMGRAETLTSQEGH